MTRQCWICFDEEETGRRWVKPCRCSGSVQWAHEACLVQWVVASGTGSCKVCHTTYRITDQRPSIVYSALDYINRTLPYAEFSAAFTLQNAAILCRMTIIGYYWHSEMIGADTWFIPPLEELVSSPHNSYYFPLVACGIIECQSNTVPVIARIALGAAYCIVTQFGVIHTPMIQLLALGDVLFPLYRWVRDTAIKPLIHSFVGHQGEEEEAPPSTILFNSVVLPFAFRFGGSMLFPLWSTEDQFALAGASYVVLKDLLSIYYRAKKTSVKNTVHILDYNEGNA